MHDVLQERELLEAVGTPLARHLVADAPHHHRGVRAEGTHHVDHVAFGPFVEEIAVAILALGAEGPVVERLDHEHQAHLVAELNQLRRRHIVTCAHRVGAHVLEHLQLMAERRFVDSGAERAEVVMVVDTLNLALDAVEVEAVGGAELYGADAEALRVRVDHIAVDHHVDNSTVERRRFRAPELRSGHLEILLHIDSRIVGVGVRVSCHHLALRVRHRGYEREFLALLQAFERGEQLDVGVFAADVRRGEVDAPDGYVDAVGGDEMHVSVKTGAGVPARGFGEVLEAYLERVDARARHPVETGGERHVTVGAIGHLTAVDVDVSVAHGAVEE